MPSLSFQKQFAERVECGEKLHSVRPKRKHPEQWMPGRKVYLFTAMRTKYCRRLGLGTITEIRDIVVQRHYLVIDSVMIDRIGDLHAFARADGFLTWDDFITFFDDFYGLPWRGDLIKWSLDQPCA